MIERYDLGETAGESIFAENTIPKLIEANILTIHHGILQQNTLDINIELARDNVFLNFYEKLFKDFEKYFANWHKATTFHIK